jgi:dUTP pyrophosphatase
MSSVQVNIINRSANPMPEYATPGSSGFDLRAWLETSVVLQPLERKLISTGLFMELPAGYEAQIRPRSGLAFKQGITCLNTPGTVDSDYRGEIKVLLVNLSDSPQEIQNGERIAQMVIMRVERAEISAVDELGDTLRGEGGFGHTGKY